MSQEEIRKFGRRPKHDDFDDLDPESQSFTGKPLDDNFEGEGADEEESEEINLDNPDFKKGELWNDYADDMDFEE